MTPIEILRESTRNGGEEYWGFKIDELKAYLTLMSRYVDEAETRACGAHKGPPEDCPWWFDDLRDRLWDTFVMSLMAETEQYLLDLSGAVSHLAPKSPPRQGLIKTAKDRFEWAGIKLPDDDWKQIVALYKLRSLLFHHGRVAMKCLILVSPEEAQELDPSELTEYDSRTYRTSEGRDTPAWIDENLLKPLDACGDICLESQRLEFGKSFCEFAVELVERHVRSLHEAIDGDAKQEPAAAGSSTGQAD